jgi:GalNAc-alpha-(1->4)-GalNAc-alpha-(1->3)-diNAcBac-PP-undecaprenol alpha-1,4-N-acetyl-D-galactosaminyltransferase
LQVQKRWELIMRNLYQRADLVTANTRTALSHMREFVEPGKLAYVPNPLPLAPANGKGNGHDKSGGRHILPQPFFLNIGRLVWDKAHDVLLDAFARLGDEHEEWRLAVVGDGRMRETLKAQAARLGVESRVHWYGIVEDPHVFYRAAKIFVLPSRIEGTPNVLLEAMSCGLPVIVSDGAPGPLELIEDGVTGLVVPVNDAVALASALRRLASDGELRARLGEAARLRVSEHDLPQALVAWESVVGLSC